jgi:hypothetical protein
MKKHIQFSLILLFSILLSLQVNAQTTISIDLPAFTEIDLDINAKVNIKQGPKQSVEVIGDKDLIDVLNKEVKGGNWDIKYTKRKVDTKKSLEINITVMQLDEVNVNGSGEVIGDHAFHGTKMEISINGSGSVQLELYVEDLELDINGSGNIALTGSAEEVEVEINGSGDIKCEELVVENAEFDINGSGNSEMHVSKKLQASLNGSGDIIYTGDPSLKVEKNGSGQIKNKESK